MTAPDLAPAPTHRSLRIWMLGAIGGCVAVTACVIDTSPIEPPTPREPPAAGGAAGAADASAAGVSGALAEGGAAGAEGGAAGAEAEGGRTGSAGAAGSAVADLDTLRGAATSQGRLFGVALAASHLQSDTPYATVAAREFGYATAENEMKWASTEPEPGVFTFGAADRIMEFAEAHGMAVKGHTLVWHSQLAPWVSSLTTEDEVRDAMTAHIAGVAGRWRGRIRAWDVVNEAFDDSEAPALRSSPFLDQLGPGYIDEAFAATRAADPDALLFYNDYGIETAGPKQDAVFELVSGLLERGVPIDGVGFQAHATGLGWPSGAALKASLERFAALGLLVNISELDVRLGTLPGELDGRLLTQAERYRDLVGACLEVPACESITVWGVSDATSWFNMEELWTWAGEGPHYPLLFAEDYTPKPAHGAVLGVLNGTASKNEPRLAR